MAPDPMDPYFAVFNSHVNNASTEADRLFREKFGDKRFDKHIAPLHEAGIMSIFDEKPNTYTKWWVIQVTAIVNGLTPEEVKKKHFTPAKAA